jgi:uncharacterized membrane protein YwaF
MFAIVYCPAVPTKVRYDHIDSMYTVLCRDSVVDNSVPFHLCHLVPVLRAGSAIPLNTRLVVRGSLLAAPVSLAGDSHNVVKAALEFFIRFHPLLRSNVFCVSHVLAQVFKAVPYPLCV